jgi:hypothetical protein
MPAWAEMSVNEAVGRQEALGLARRFEPLHLPFAAPGWAMRVLCPIVQVAAFAVLDVRQKLTLRHAIALQLVRDKNARHILQTLQQPLEETPRGPGVAAALHQDIEDDAVLIDSTPQIMLFALDPDWVPVASRRISSRHAISPACWPR